MKSLKTLLLTKSISAALIAIGGAAAPAISHASPDDGMVCRAGYEGALVGTHFKCVKSTVIIVGLECTSLVFRNRVIRAPGAPGDSSGGRDICTRNGINVGSTDALTGLVKGQDYVDAQVNPATVAARVAVRDLQEAATAGLPPTGVDTRADQPVVSVNGGIGSTDEARVRLRIHTFAIPAL